MTAKSMITPEHALAITTAPKRNSLHWKASSTTWAEIIEWMDTPGSRKEAGNYVLGTFERSTVRHPGSEVPCTNLHRTKRAVRTRGALTLDVDYPLRTFEDAVAELGVACIIHTTFSSIPELPRYRLIIPLSRALTPDEYTSAADSVMETLGAAQFDPGSNQPERYMFLPAENEPGNFWFAVHQGPLAGVDSLLEDFEADLTHAPAPAVHKNKRDPFEIQGVVGAFNRAYQDLPNLISEYDLPYQESGADRWQLVGASAAAGMGLVQPGLMFSHHSNDPAYGQTCSAFDLVRLHLFGDRDETAKPGTPINKMPSTIAMQELATQDLRVVQELVGKDFDEAMTATADSIVENNWRLGFDIDGRSGKPRDDISNWDLIAENDPVFKSLFYNEMSMALETDSDLPWRKLLPGREVFDTGDRSSLALHIERTYKIRPSRSYMDDLIADRARNRRVNPVKDYLDSLVWDGTPRVETCLPGVKDTQFTRIVARKSLVAAVARVYEPGCDWDHMLVLSGPEGLGKTKWVSKLARGFQAPLGKLGDKDTLVTLQRAWILTADESHSLRKADFDAQKEFLTRTEDVFRMPYDREAAVHKRRFVIWGSTNDEVFLRNQQGNRRFLIVKCEERMDFDLLTDAYIGQLWAEAVHYYRAGEQMWLSDEESSLAANERLQFTEEDALSGIIHEYLETKVPPSWDAMTPLDRQLWLMNNGDELSKDGTESIDEVCSVQIWVEALGRRPGDHKRVDLLEITSALKQLDGWVLVQSRHRISGYGPQLVFRRKSSLAGMELI